MVITRRLLATLAGLLLVVLALAGTATAQPTTTEPSAPPTTTAPASPSTTTPAPSTTPSAPTTAAPSGDDECNGVSVPVVGCVPTPGQVLSSAAGEAAKDAGSNILSTMVDWVLAGFVWIMKYVIQLFMGTSVDVSNTQGAVQKMADLTGDLQTLALGLGLLIALITVLYQRAMLSGDNAAPEAIGGLVRWAVAAAMAAPVLLALSGVSDALASWIFTSAAGPEGPTRVVDGLSSALSGRDERLKTEDVISLALCILGLLAYLELLIQLVMQKFWIIYAAVALPIAGAASVVGGGKTVFWALFRAAIAALLFKPIAAIAFGVGFMQIRSLESGADVVTAVTLMVAPAFILPLLVNMIGTNVSYAGTPMLRGTIRNGRAGIQAGRNALNTGKDGAKAAGGAALTGAAAAGRGTAKAVPFIGAMGRAAAHTLTGPPPSRSSGSNTGNNGNRATASASGSGTTAAAPSSGGNRGQGGTPGTRNSASTNAATSGTRNTTGSASTTGGRTSSTANAPSTSSTARTSASASSPGTQSGAPTRQSSGRARNSTRAGASSDTSTEHTPRPGRSAASSSPPRDSAFRRIT
ncbi:hypothetical protein [Nocardia salmonicida]|uniref:hypothetical protein n=1 Tax=Nocardia salmonicida TaxID=53431 RepID=UPI000AB821C7|nr:hypothetical protein [Nocardia salmonicida]